LNSPNTTNALAEDVYRRLKQEIFDFYLLPYDRFTETQLADRWTHAAAYRGEHLR